MLYDRFAATSDGYGCANHPKPARESASMPDRNFIRPMMPTQADVMYSINTISDRSDDLAADANEERLAREAEQGSGRLRGLRLISRGMLLPALALFVSCFITHLLTK